MLNCFATAAGLSLILNRMTYKEQLSHPKWQKKRLEILQRDKFTCQICSDTETQLHIHHTEYDKTYKTKAWEYPNHIYKTLCSDCHKSITEHIQEHGNDKEFDVMKVISPDGIKAIFVYTKGLLKINPMINGITEQTSHKVVQFLINNWLKHG